MNIRIKNKFIGEKYPVFIIAEAGVNHNGRLKNAYKLVDIACDSGADAIKFQTFTAKEISTVNAPKSSYHIETTGSDKKQSWYDLLTSQELSFDMHKKLISYCNKKNIIFLSTPYGKDSVDMLEKLKVPAYKIASTDNNNLELISYIAKKKKPMMVSTVMSKMKDVEKVYKTILKSGLKKIVLLQCTGNYPSKITDSNLNVIKTYKKRFNCLVGYSDHTENNISCIASIALGVSVIEKHFTISKKLKGPDHRMSLEPKELKETIKLIRETEKSLGIYEKRILKSEIENSKKLKKSLISKKFITKGTKISSDMITAKRPGYGISPSQYKNLVNTIAKVDIPKETFFNKNMFYKKK